MKDYNEYPSFEEAMKGDSMIFQLASYDVCKGMMLVPKDMDEAIEIQKNG